MAAELTREYVNRRECEAPAHVLFPQLRQIVERYLRENESGRYSRREIIDVFCSPYYGWVIERLMDAIKPDMSQGEAPDSADIRSEARTRLDGRGGFLDEPRSSRSRSQPSELRGCRHEEMGAVGSVLSSIERQS